MRQDAPYFEGKDPVLVYIAKKLKDALRLELLQSFDSEIRDETTLGWQRQWLIELPWENRAM